MSEQTEELADTIRNAPVTGGPDVDLSRPLAHHLQQQGYRKPRTITTAEELDALQMAVIRSDAGSIANIVNGRAYFFGYEASVPVATIALPATVLYEPEA